LAVEQNLGERVSAKIINFKLPEYEQIPDVGLYLEQTVRFIDEHLAPLPNVSITGSMVSNYVKKGLIPNPVKKLYDREQIAWLIFIAVAKSVLSLEDIGLLIELGKKSYPTPRAYEYFVREFMNVLHYVFGLKETLDNVGVDSTEEKALLRNTIFTVALKIYLDMCFAAIHGDVPEK